VLYGDLSDTYVVRPSRYDFGINVIKIAFVPRSKVGTNTLYEILDEHSLTKVSSNAPMLACAYRDEATVLATSSPVGP
jgi:hypothetical protein